MAYSRFGTVALVCLLAACGAADSPPAASGAAAERADASLREPLSGASIPLGRLPEVAIPLRYVLELTVVPDRERFSGHADIGVRLTSATDHIFMHGKDLDVSTASLLTGDGERIALEYRQVSDDGVVYLKLPQTLEPQEIVLEFDYTAPFDRRLHGLYRVDEDGVSYAFTQLQALYARQMFPSFDEPAFKTPYDVSLVVRPGDTAIANTPLVETLNLENGLKRLRFAPTPPLPTYLIAIAVGDFDVVEAPPIAPNAVRARPLPLRGVAVKGKGAELEYALENTGTILADLEVYFDLPYPYRKLDVIAVPDFEAGAMENVGAITFRESLLLLRDQAPLQQKRAFASVMAHELAHMWFGDLVTMPWWDDIWLNEAFATWMSYKSVYNVSPEHNPFARKQQRIRLAMTEDALASARQIREPVADADGVVAAFDGITYSKGAAVLTMFERYIGADRFRAAVRQHIRDFAVGSADVEDFVASLNKQAPADILPAFRGFLYQNGIPQIEARADCETGTVTLTQSRYLPAGSEADTDREWIVPVCLRYGAGGDAHEQCTLLNAREQTIDLQHARCPDWLLPNAGYAGYYHFTLPRDGYRALHAAGDQLSELEWLAVADSIRAGLDSGTLSVGDAWESIAPLAHSEYTTVAIAPAEMLEYFADRLATNPKVAARIRGEAAAAYAHLPVASAFVPEFMSRLASDDQRLLYADVARYVARVARVPEVRRSALAHAQAYLEEGPAAVSPASVATALEVGVQDGGSEFVDQLLKDMLASRNGLFRDYAIKALARTHDPELADRMRDLAKSGELRAAEIYTLLREQVREPVGRELTWKWLKNNFEEVAALMPARHAARLPRMPGELCDLAQADDTATFFADKVDRYASGDRELAKATEAITVCARRTPLQRKDAQAYFLGYKGR